MKPITQVKFGDCTELLKHIHDCSIQCCVTSPPYFGLRDYGIQGQIGAEVTPDEYLDKLCLVFDEVFRVLRPDGLLWLNIGDSYSGSGRGLMGDGTHSYNPNAKQATNRGTTKGTFVKTLTGCKQKELIGIPWRLALALRERGWYLRQDIIWRKPNPMPESVKDRCTRAHEYLFLMSKSKTYKYNHVHIMEPSADGIKNRRSVWDIAPSTFKGAHFATFPPDLVELCLKASITQGDVVLDPFGGSGTVAGVANRLGAHARLLELNPEYAALIKKRVQAIRGWI